jgi:DNA-binding MarR family transcriptional regulator
LTIQESRSASKSAPLALSEDKKRLILDNYVQYFIGAISNNLLRVSSKVYQKRFDVSPNDWRTLAMLANESDITASRISEAIGFDKAAVSRSIRILENRGYITTRGIATHNRARLIALTRAGRNLHNRIMNVALEREAILLDGLSPAEVQHLLKALRVMRRNCVSLLARTEKVASD